MAADDVVTMRERIGRAVNCSDPRTADILGAMGAATHVRQFDDAAQRSVAKVTAIGTPVFHSGRQLAALLERAKYGLDRAALHPAVLQFAHLLCQSAAGRSWKLHATDALLIRFAGLVVTEWLHDKCQQCGGAGKLLIGPSGRNAKTKGCGVCRGLGLPRRSLAQRAQVLGMEPAVFEKHWAKRLDEAARQLTEFEACNMGHLHRQLKAGTLSHHSVL